MKKDPTLKIIGLSTLGLFVLFLVKSVFFPTGYGMSVGYNMPRYYTYGYNNSFGINGFITSIIQVLLVVFIVGLLVAIVMIVKNNLLNLEEFDSIKEKFGFSTTVNDIKEKLSDEETNEPTETLVEVPNQAEKSKKTCPECGYELDPEWKICLNCGKELKKSRKKKTTESQ
ncbi:zinc ribbon domain-containing protein [Neobacillus sp. LXY-4]|uniref:zinc ribbon domain-containing protein n=1 Tax=Neobacillus sp. LXY-4 TaxID=3379826 RepID=UPI003EE261C9